MAAFPAKKTAPGQGKTNFFLNRVPIILKNSRQAEQIIKLLRGIKPILNITLKENPTLLFLFSVCLSIY